MFTQNAHPKKSAYSHQFQRDRGNRGLPKFPAGIPGNFEER